MFGKAKGLMGSISQAREMQKKAKEIDSKLASIEFEVENDVCKLTVNGKREVLAVKIVDNSNIEKLEAGILSALKQSNKKADEVAMNTMRGMFTV